MVVDIREGFIKQEVLEELVAAQNEVREAKERRAALRQAVALACIKGVPVEPGIHTATIRTRRTRRGMRVRLRVR